MTMTTEGSTPRKHGSKAMQACKNMKPSLALWVGHDLDEPAEKEVRRHVAICEGCRDYSQDLRESQEVLEQAVAQTVPVTDSPSVWPELRATLLHRARRAGTVAANSASAGFWRIQNLLPVGALSAACLTIWFASNNQAPSDWPSAAPVARTQSSGLQPVGNWSPIDQSAEAFPATRWNNDSGRNLHHAMETPRDLNLDH